MPTLDILTQDALVLLQCSPGDVFKVLANELAPARFHIVPYAFFFLRFVEVSGP